MAGCVSLLGAHGDAELVIVGIPILDGLVPTFTVLSGDTVWYFFWNPLSNSRLAMCR